MEGKGIDKRTGYWDIPLSAEEKENLDLDLIEELNNAGDEEDPPEQPPREYRKRPLFRLVGVIAMLAFTAIFAGSYFWDYQLPPLNFLSQSGALKETPEVQAYEKAVVMIETEDAMGTGFNIDPEGLIVTNAHVVNHAKAVLVKFFRGKIYPAARWVSFPEVDLALIKIRGENLPKLDLAGDEALEPGSKVIIIGNPLGFPFVASTGTVSGQILLDGAEPVWQIESYIYRGSSGSPVINSRGKVAGIIFASLESSQQHGQGQETGFAIPVESLNQRLKTKIEWK